MSENRTSNQVLLLTLLVPGQLKGQDLPTETTTQELDADYKCTKTPEAHKFKMAMMEVE
jgi:hypothetical protein